MPSSLERFIGQPLGQVQHLGWFGFAADPPTLAHRAVVDAALGSGVVQKLIVFPAGTLPYKTFTASDWQRMEMTEIWKQAAGFEDDVILSRFDLMREQAMTWIDLWRRIIQLAPKIEHWLIVGADQYREIPLSWDEGEALLQEARFLIVPREGIPVDPVFDHHRLLQVPPVSGSSTAVRNGTLDLVDEPLQAYLQEQHLYQ